MLRDVAPEELTDPVAVWSVARECTVSTTVPSTTAGDLEDIRGLPDTLGYDLAREGVRLLVIEGLREAS